MAKRRRGDADQEHEVADRVAEGECRDEGIRVEGLEDGSEERVPDDDPAADEHDQRVDREAQGLAPDRRRALEEEQGGDHDQVVDDVQRVGPRHRGDAAAADVHPGPEPVGRRVHEHREADEHPREANSSNVEAQRDPKDDRGREQVQGRLADVGDDDLRERVPDAEHEPGDREAPTPDSEGQDDPIQRHAAAKAPVRM